MYVTGSTPREPDPYICFTAQESPFLTSTWVVLGQEGPWITLEKWLVYMYLELKSGSSPTALGFGETCLAALQRGGKLGQLSGALTCFCTCGWEPSVPWAGSWDL